MRYGRAGASHLSPRLASATSHESRTGAQRDWTTSRTLSPSCYASGGVWRGREDRTPLGPRTALVRAASLGRWIDVCSRGLKLAGRDVGSGVFGLDLE